MEKLVFGTFAASGKSEEEAILLAKSLRRFGGENRLAAMHIFMPDSLPFSEKNQALLKQLNVDIHSLELPEAILNFPFASKTLASGVFETAVGSSYDLLVWMDRDSIIINDPNDLILPDGKLIGYRPVDHRLIGSLWDQPKDPFWETLYDHFTLKDEYIFAMMTSVDQAKIRPYINAGMLVVRPGVGLLQAWSETFKNCMHLEIFEKFYRENSLYRIFIHQAVLSVILCQRLEESQFFKLPYKINYPLHMHSQYPAKLKARKLNELITCRHDRFFEKPGWESEIPIDEPLLGWLRENIQTVIDA
jgi:hypothetical protein